MKVVSLALLPVWTYYMTREEYGVVGTLAAWAGVLSPLLCLGVPSAVVKHRIDLESEPEEWGSYLFSCMIFTTALSMAFLGGMVLFGERVWMNLTSGEIPFWPIVPITAVAVAFSVITRIAQGLFQARQHALGQVAIIQGVFVISVVGGLVLLIVFGWGPTGVQAGALLGHAVVGAVALPFVICREMRPRFSGAHLRTALVFGLPLVPQAMAAWFLSASDRVMIEKFRTLAEVGVYNLAGNLAIVMSVIAVSLNQAWTPYYFKMMRTESEEVRDRKTARFTGYCLAGLAASAIGMVLFGPEVVLLMAHERFSGATEFVSLIVFGYLAYGIYVLTLKPLMFDNRNGLVAGFTVAAAVMNVGLNLWLIPIYGAIAAAWTTAVSYAAVAVVAWVIARRSHPYPYPKPAYLTILAVAGAVFIGSFWLEDATFEAVAIKAGILVVATAILLGLVYAIGKQTQTRTDAVEN